MRASSQASLLRNSHLGQESKPTAGKAVENFKKEEKKTNNISFAGFIFKCRLPEPARGAGMSGAAPVQGAEW